MLLSNIDRKAYIVYGESNDTVTFELETLKGQKVKFMLIEIWKPYIL